MVNFLFYWQKVACCWLLVKKTFMLLFEIEQFLSFRVCSHSLDSLAVHQQQATSNQQQTTTFPACPGWGFKRKYSVNHLPAAGRRWRL